MRLRCIGSGSDGNCYSLTDDAGDVLLLDLGMSEKEIKVALDFDISSIVGACVTHSHLDHSKSAKRFEDMGIKVFKPYECSHFQTANVTFGNFKVTAFSLDDKNCEHWQHTNTDDTECPIYGFYIMHPELSSPFIYCTDCKLIKWNFKKMKPAHILLGVDYQPDLLDEESAKFRHQIEGHMSIETACDFIKANKTDELLNVILGHLSGDSSDSDSFICEVNKIVSCPIYVAYKGMEIDLSLPF